MEDIRAGRVKPHKEAKKLYEQIISLFDPRQDPRKLKL
jgi:hypothetical protein